MTKSEIKNLFGKNYLGLAELQHCFDRIGLNISDEYESEINFSDSELKSAAADGYILVYGIDHIGGNRITLKFLRDSFGIDPEKSEPCFYNQDWYMNEDFMNHSLKKQWYLIKKNAIEDTRAVMPTSLMDRGIVFPSAILCGYTFFTYYFANNEYLWYHDFIWCKDEDHNGDRIYVGKYNDVDGINKNGFSIHRHLALRPCYAAICSF